MRHREQELLSDPKVDRSQIVIVDLHDNSDESAFWATQSPQERIAAIELMRSVVYGYGEDLPRLQRVLEIVDRT